VNPIDRARKIENNPYYHLGRTDLALALIGPALDLAAEFLPYKEPRTEGFAPSRQVLRWRCPVCHRLGTEKEALHLDECAAHRFMTALEAALKEIEHE
jgi:hypothetical protein